MNHMYAKWGLFVGYGGKVVCYTAASLGETDLVREWKKAKTVTGVATGAGTIL